MIFETSVTMKNKQLIFWLLSFLTFMSINLDVLAKVGFIFSHGYKSNKNAIKHFTKAQNKQYYIIDHPWHYFNYNDALPGGSDDTKSNFGQTEDLKYLGAAHDYIKTQKKVDECVLVGVSRGASAIINYASTNPGNIKALVAECPFDMLENVITNILNGYNLGWMPFIGAAAIKYRFPSYDFYGIKPIDAVKNIEKNLPILLIHSKQDTLIPLSCSQNLYNALKAAGHKHSYLLILDYGAHGKCCISNDAYKYHATIHAFYKKYGIACDDKLARAGAQFLADAQP